LARMRYDLNHARDLSAPPTPDVEPVPPPLSGKRGGNSLTPERIRNHNKLLSRKRRVSVMQLPHSDPLYKLVQEERRRKARLRRYLEERERRRNGL